MHIYTRPKAKWRSMLIVGDVKLSITWEIMYISSYDLIDKSLSVRPFEKLGPKFFGPYKILRKIGKVVYKLELLESSMIHPIFHVSQLCRAITDPSLVLTSHLDIDSEGQWTAKPEEVLSTWQKAHGLEVLIHWANTLEKGETWETAHSIHGDFPDFPLEDKVAIMGGYW